MRISGWQEHMEIARSTYILNLLVLLSFYCSLHLVPINIIGLQKKEMKRLFNKVTNLTQ